MKRTFLYIFFSLYVSYASFAQDSLGGKRMTLQEVIDLAQRQSVEATVALAQYRTAYWQYRTYKANLLPEVSFQGTLPNYKSAFDLYQEGDGGFKFLRTRLFQSSGTVSIDQNIPLTGGRVSILSSLEYVRTDKSSRHFMSIPVTVTLVQPIFGFNNLKWQRRIQPLKFEEAKAAYLEERERITMQSIQNFFQLLLADEQLRTARQNKANAAKLYEVAKVKREMGQISRNDLLQLELNLLQAEGKETSAISERNSKVFTLKAFLGMETDEDIHLIVPEVPESRRMSYADVLERARDNNAFSHRIRRRQLEVDSEVAKAKGERFKIDLYASVGLTGQHRELREAYSTLIDNRIVQVGVRIPILDWGKRKAQVRMAQSNRDVVQAQVRQEAQRFDQDIFLLVEHFNNQAQQLDIASKASDIADQRYRTNIETFMIGKISTLELNDAQRVRDEAKQTHISELFYYWYYLYQIRSLTLYDYDTESAVSLDFDALTGS